MGSIVRMLCLTTLTLLLIHLFHHTQAQRVVVSGYNSKLATYQVSGEDLILTGEWDVGLVNQNMTWLQLDNDINSIWAGHEVANYSGKPGSSVGGSSPAIKMGKDQSLNNLLQQEVFTQHIFWLTRNREWLMQQTMVVAPLLLFPFMETSWGKLSTESSPRTVEMQVIPMKQ